MEIPSLKVIEEDQWLTKCKSGVAHGEVSKPRTKLSLANQILLAAEQYAGTPYNAQFQLKREKIIKAL